MKIMKKIACLFMVLITAVMTACSNFEPTQKYDIGELIMNTNELKALMEKVNDYWIGQNPDVGDCAWERAAYFLGNMAAYEMTGKQEYLDYAAEWAKANEWKVYNGEKTNADSILCVETYIELLDKYGVKGTDEHFIKDLEWTLSDPANDYWWWVDTIYMAPTVYNKLAIRENNPEYYEKSYRLYHNSKVERTCFSEEDSLWWRDERFLPGNEMNPEGKKIYWSRGNGWIFAGLGRLLESIDESNPYYTEYRNMFVRMAAAIKKCQLPDGFWHTDLFYPERFDMPETSGTVLFVLGYLKGIRLGILNKDEYYDATIKGFDALTNESLEDSGRLGWVQGVAWDPTPVDKGNTNNYAVGAYLQVIRELIRINEG